MTTGEIARRLGVSVPTVKKWIRTGQLTAFRTPGGHYRVPDEAFVRLAARLGLEPAGPPARPATILVVDDDSRFLEVATAALDRPDGVWKVEVAQDGYEALIRLGLTRPDALILDIRMPHLDGFEVCRRIRSDPALAATAILAVTGFGEIGTEAEIRAAGADDYLEKPFGVGELRARVAALLRRGRVPARDD